MTETEEINTRFDAMIARAKLSSDLRDDGSLRLYGRTASAAHAHGVAMIRVVLTQRARGVDAPMVGGYRWDVPIDRTPRDADALDAAIEEASVAFLCRFPSANGAYCFGTY
jgi:hypothetical protein